MSGRIIDSATATALVQPSLWLCWILRLDIQNDPLYINSGITDLFFSGGSGYDPAIVGFTFKAAGNLGTIEPITDAIDGSQALNLSLPGVDLTQDYLHQLIQNGDLWQRRLGYLWAATMDATGALIGKPIRVKSARMDQMPIKIDPDSSTGTLTVTLESQQAYSSEALASRYSEQSQIDNTDTSQNFVQDLANKTPEIGNSSSNASGQSGIGNAIRSAIQTA